MGGVQLLDVWYVRETSRRVWAELKASAFQLLSLTSLSCLVLVLLDLQCFGTVL